MRAVDSLLTVQLQQGASGANKHAAQAVSSTKACYFVLSRITQPL